MDIPQLKANAEILENLVSYIFMHESELIKYGALKIQILPDCVLALKTRKPISTPIASQEIIKTHDNELIYSVRKAKLNSENSTDLHLQINHEKSFWTTLSSTDVKFFHWEVTNSPKKSLFYDKRSKKCFSTYRIADQSLLCVLPLKTRQMFVPSTIVAHGPGAIFPLAVTPHGLSSLVYHHHGSARQWYIIPVSERENLRILIEQDESEKCIHHDSLLIDPTVLDKYQIRYHRLIQYPNEIVVLAPGAVTQGFAIGSCWSESCVFALPCWIRDGHAFADWTLCRHHINVALNVSIIDKSIFTEANLQRFIHSYLTPSTLSKCRNSS